MELLVVMAIIVIMASLAGPAFNAMKGGSDLTKTTSDISDLLQQARSYAMANNTYVYFGIKETDADKNDLSDGTGRVAVAIVASKNGSRPYGNTPGKLPDATAANGVTPISRVQKFENAHLATTDLPNTGGLADRATGSNVTNLMKTSNAATTFDVKSGGSTGTFDRVIEFDPQGVPRIQNGGAAGLNEIDGWIEIGLQPSHGSTGPGANEKNVAALQVDGMTGAVRVYRP